MLCEPTPSIVMAALWSRCSARCLFRGRALLSATGIQLDELAGKRERPPRYQRVNSSPRSHSSVGVKEAHSQEGSEVVHR